MSARRKALSRIVESLMDRLEVPPPAEERISPLGVLAAAWGLVGVSLLLLRAVWRLTPVAIEAFTGPELQLSTLALATAWLGFMGYSEGYKGFQKGFAPRVVARALHLARRPRPLHALLAPMYCIGLIHASRRRLIASWTILVMIVAMVIAVGYVSQPYRGIIDAGVVLGLGWGLAAMIVFVARALAGKPPRVAADLPDAMSAPTPTPGPLRPAG